MATNTERNMISSSFDSVFVDDISVSIFVHEVSVFSCFHYI